MPKQQSQYTRREFRGQKHGTDLVKYLNDAEAEDLKWAGRIVELLAALQELQTYATEDQAHGDRWWRPTVEPRATWEASGAERQRLEYRIADLLTKYGPYSAILRLDRAGTIRFNVAYNRYAKIPSGPTQAPAPQKPPRKMTQKQIRQAMQEIHESIRRKWLAHGEWWALYAVLNLAAEGAVDVVQRCQYQPCHRWYFRQFAHRKACSPKCALRLYRATDKWKAYHKEKERKRRLK
jgi:hypothetical protein